MAFDFALILVIATFSTGLIWLGDILVFSRFRAVSQSGHNAGEPKEPIIVEYAKAFFPILLIVLVIRSFLIEPFRIPSGSMIPTLKVNDFIAVNKFAYGVRLPVLNKKIVEIGEPGRGDVVVFKYPRNPKLDYIKRVIGLPGDRIEYRDKNLYINGELVESTMIGDYKGKMKRRSFVRPKVFHEKLPDAAHDVLIHPNRPSIDKEVIVPPGHYFMMGDNRDDSNDSRVWGFVPEKNLVGEAVLIWMHWDFGWDFDWRRIGNSID